ncbi:uncharacterized protein BCR38DRAFT_456717 [Pseudomassariella vexata]|uniref:DUF221-domain-containing protein n=1 Tax=Pseudomassariella vexata TaxID=1141098 RepID=A0A1Y2E5D7_9PEZI|nr:uncharacterized protein BCR38DRAFT_456717 [Pseudomassariella vexata]ORY66075.1 hypothetical protein BCR38DRAFT_456717 [Pseudomassariella vexata]
MDVLVEGKKCDPHSDKLLVPGSKDVYVQLVISLVLGVSAFIAFCILRPRWPSLYAARKRHHSPLIALPTLPDSFFGWIPALYKITEEQVLASAGLDAYVFLSFFKMAIRLFTAMFFFAAVVLWPINHRFVGDLVLRPSDPDSNSSFYSAYTPYDLNLHAFVDEGKESGGSEGTDLRYLWSYLVFTWFFSFLTIYYMNSETFKIIKVRQDYLGTQSTITDRTFRLTGIPKDLRSEEKIKEFVENLEIGNVTSVTLCRDWAEIDALMVERDAVLRKLEEAWSVYLAQKPNSLAATHASPNVDDDGTAADDGHENDAENGRLLAGDSLRNLMVERPRPTTRIRFGFLKLRSRQTDAIDHYEEKLRRIDQRIQSARKKEYLASATAFVTMDSIAACQMAIQAVVDPRPGQLLSKPAPAPSDVVWKNTYASPYKRRLQSWLITIFITILTIIWLAPVGSLAAFTSICTIEEVSPSLAATLLRHEITKALVQTALPVAVISLLNVAVPYLYDYLANQQGMISQGDVELSVISKNFFFTFFNVFLVFAAFGSVTNMVPILRESFHDARLLMRSLATSIKATSNFYLNFILLQGLGLFPFRLLQVGGVALYPIYRMGAKTPRDFAEMVQPTLFNYGFYLPTALLVYILCLVYSIIPGSHIVLLVGLVYFSLGYFVHKYQLLYSMDQPQHATGGAWRIICFRILFGLAVFQVVMAGILSLQLAFTASALVAPLLIITIWYSYYFNRRFTPLTRFIALRSIKRATDSGVEDNPGEYAEQSTRQTRLTRRMSTIDEDKEKGMSFENPSLVLPLQQPWIYKNAPAPLSPEESANATTESNMERDGDVPTPGTENGAVHLGLGSGSSSFSLGDTHVWRESGGNNM